MSNECIFGTLGPEKQVGLNIFDLSYKKVIKVLYLYYKSYIIEFI
jgi:hypothetical protein